MNATKLKMKEVLSEIQSGQFANEWVSSYKNKGKNAFQGYMQDIENHQIEKVGKEMRKMMWPDEQWLKFVFIFYPYVQLQLHFLYKNRNVLY